MSKPLPTKFSRDDIEIRDMKLPEPEWVETPPLPELAGLPAANGKNYMIQFGDTPDLSAALKIEQDSFKHAWDKQDFISYKPAMTFPSSIKVATYKNEIVGYMVYTPFDDDNGVGGIQLINFAVAEKFRRCGIGSIMMDYIKNELDEKHPQILFDIWERNEKAQGFLPKQGFRAAGVIHHLYDTLPEDDGYCMKYHRDPELGHAQQVQQRRESNGPYPHTPGG